jgi:hypothetical protein
VLSYVGRGLLVDQFSVQEVLPKYLKEFIVSEVSESEEARSHNV